jgi:hypothetical protein
MFQVCEKAVLRAEAPLPVPISGFLDLARSTIYSPHERKGTILM